MATKGRPPERLVFCSIGSHDLCRSNVGKQLLRELHAARDVAWFSYVQIQGKYCLRATFFHPSHEPADCCAHAASGRFIIHAD